MESLVYIIKLRGSEIDTEQIFLKSQSGNSAIFGDFHFLKRLKKGQKSRKVKLCFSPFFFVFRPYLNIEKKTKQKGTDLEHPHPLSIFISHSVQIKLYSKALNGEIEIAPVV